MPVRFKLQPMTYDQLAMAAAAPNANSPEVIPWAWYDSQDFASNATSVAFFATPSSDITISNIEQANTFSAEQYFRLQAITLDFLMGASQNNNAAAQQYDDARIIQDTARTIFSLTLGQKIYAQYPIHAIHASGGVQAIVQGQPAANALFNTVQNYLADGGYVVNGAILFPPKQTFTARLAATAAALTATRKLRLTFHGELFRRVL